MRSAIFPLAAVLIAACSRTEKAPELAPQTPVAEVAAADSFGAEGRRVSDAAFWSHPAVAFESLLLAAGEADVSAYRIETGQEVFKIPVGADGIEVVYAGVGVEAAGYLLAAGDGELRLFQIHPDGTGFEPVALGDAGLRADAFCAGGGDAPAIVAIEGGRPSVRALTISADGADLGPARAPAAIEDAVACAVDPRDDSVIVVSRDGAVRRIDPKTGAVFGIALPVGLSPSSAALAIGRDEAGAPVTQVALLDAASGVISLFDAKDGHALGAVRIKATFDLGAVAAASRIVIGSANYGGVYRDGALAVVTSDGGAPVRLVPWNGVMGALSLPVAAVADPRAPKATVEEDGVISIEVIEP